MGQPRGEPLTTTEQHLRRPNNGSNAPTQNSLVMVGKAGRIGCRSGWQMESRDSGVLVRTCQRQGTNRATAASGSTASRVVSEVECDVGMQRRHWDSH